jgi:hypothetical protein
MIRPVNVATGLLLLAGLASASAADITGRITLKGTPAPEKAIPLDPSCGKLWPADAKATTRFYITGPDGGLADVFVYLTGVSGQSEVPSGPALLDQKRCEYVPQILGLQVGQKLLIRNSDPVLHNVHATPKINREFNLAQMAGGKDIERTFDKPEVFVRFKCDVHPWMFAYVGVLPHSYYAVTDKDGSFKIENVPPGTYKLVAFHRKTHVTEDRAQTRDITVGDEPVTADFTIEVPAQ